VLVGRVSVCLNETAGSPFNVEERWVRDVSQVIAVKVHEVAWRDSQVLTQQTQQRGRGPALTRAQGWCSRAEERRRLAECNPPNAVRRETDPGIAFAATLD
jgi:hypothetical protein